MDEKIARKLLMVIFFVLFYVSIYFLFVPVHLFAFFGALIGLVIIK